MIKKDEKKTKKFSIFLTILLFLRKFNWYFKYIKSRISIEFPYLLESVEFIVYVLRYR